MQPEYSQEPRQQPQSTPLVPGGDPRPGAPRQRVRLQLPTPQPTFTYVLLGAIIVVYLLGQIFPEPPQRVVMGYRVTNTEDWMVVAFAKVNQFILQDGQVYRLLTSMFLHSGIAHLFFNGWALYVIGQDIERLFGHVRFLLIYFLGGLTASVASMILSPEAWSVGASGAIFAIFGAEMVFLYRNRVLFGELARRRLTTLLYLLALNLFIGVFANTVNSATGAGLIDNWAHVGGFLGGLALAWLLGPLFKAAPPVSVPSETPGTPSGVMIPLEDQNPPSRWMFAPFAWAALLVLVVGAMLMGQ
jgi:membrane associated rhomboid family serine protease